MVTETVVLDRDDGSWRSVVNTTGTIVISGMTAPIRIRMGINSTSEGWLLEVNDVLTAQETIYIQPTKKGLRGSGITTVYVNKG